MTRGIRKRGDLVLSILFLLWAVPAAAQTDIRPTPGGKRLLFVDGNDIRPTPGGPRLLYVDGKNIRPDPGGKRLMFVEGDDVRHEPGGIRLAYLDGKTIRRKPGSKILLYVHHPDIRPDPHGERLLYIDGKELTRPQLVAVLMRLKPEIFKLTPEEEAQLKKEFAAARAEEPVPAADQMSGNFSIAVFSSTDGQKRSGKVAVQKKGDQFTLTFTFKEGEEWQGVAVQKGEELWAAIGPVNTVGLAVYDIKGGKLDGVWVPFYAPGMDKANLGTEQLAGSEKLDGEYQITAAKAPKTGEPYAGTVTIAPQELQLDGDVNTYRMTWHFGEAKVHGVGIRVDNSLVVSSGTGKEFAVVRFKLNQGNLVGDFFTSGAAKGYYTLLKE